MSKVGVNLSIDVTKIDKNLLYKGNKGTYLNAVVFIDIDQKDQYDNNGMITQKVGKDAPKGNILGNCKVFWKDNLGGRGGATEASGNPNAHQGVQQPSPSADQFDDDIPF
jgi:hypothetical protein